VDPEGLSPDYDKDGDGEVDGNADLSQLAPSPDIPTVSAKDLILMATPVLVGLSPMLPSGGGLNLFKKGKPSTSTSQGWKTGDRMLILRDTGSVKANWNQNASIIRSEMRKGKPIFDSYKRQTTGKRIPTGGFIKGERNLFENKGWEYNPSTGAYHPPGT
ncbi:MAG: hypothetical protein KJ804_12340, partial [Proteobacteria bacterium]|nr:hypothetical protein [Pseudomonadota bacterium]MBU1059093.1 hypothetical protein [Pseudomonadota bacterium]